MRIFYALLFCLNCTLLSAQTRLISGKITDSQNQQALAFVSIAVEGTQQGTLTDVDGKFTLKISANAYLLISYVGYENQRISAATIVNNKINIELSPKTNELAEVRIRPTEDPAYSVMRVVIANKPNNDPEQLPSFRYNAYTMAGLGTKITTIKPANPKKPSSKIETPKVAKKPKPPVVRSPEKKAEDSLMIAIVRQLAKNYLFVTESYTLRDFVKPNLSKEKILATRFSGIKKSPLALVASNFQPFGFYRDFIRMVDKIYESPMSGSAIRQYEFVMADTLLHETDSTYVILFEPKYGKNFEGLSGRIYINSASYAIENVIAQPAETLNRKINFRLQQMYERVEGHWFPKQLNTEIMVNSIQQSATGRIDSTTSQWTTRSYIYNIDFKNPAPRSYFTDIVQEIDNDARTKSDEYWTNIRQDSLQQKEQATYKAWAKMPEKIQNKINKTSNVFFDLILSKSVPLGKNLEIPFKYLLNSVNQYEKTRVGFGLRTTPNFAHWLTLEAGAGYGFGDKALKYSGSMQFNFTKTWGNYLRFSYLQDLAEPGSNTNFQLISSNLLDSPIRKFIANRMDSVRSWSVDLGLKPFRKTQLRFWLMNETRNPALYQYDFQNADNKLISSFQNTEIGMTFRLASEERLMRMGRLEFTTQPPNRQLMVQISKGLSGVLGSSLDYTKFDLQYTQTWMTHGLGRTTYQLNVGQVIGQVPYSYLFNGMGVGGTKNALWIANSFQTMGIYEFMSDQYANLFLSHNFGKLLFRSNFKYSQPELSLHQGIGYGKLANPENHQNLAFKTLEKGYYESGLYVNNLVRVPYAGVMYMGLGAGVFYRYGANALPQINQNIAFKWGLWASF